MKVGIPRALLYYRYGEFWKSFFKCLNVDFIISPPTNKKILDQGVKYVSSEVCLPVKIICGHLDWLKNKATHLFLPRFVELNNGLYTCPKMIGIVDIARFHFQNYFQIISPKIKNNFYWTHFKLGLKLTKNPLKVKNAIDNAQKYLNSYPKLKANGAPKILLLSHFYNIYDYYISQPIIETFKNQGFTIITKEHLDNKRLNSTKGFAKNIRWVYERELYNAFYYFLPQVQGVCNIISFGCGPDSLISEVMLNEAHIQNKPFLQLIIDEHTSATGLITRIEAFCEIIKKRLDNNVSSIIL
ncbi:MAG: acyl-CoA dehydratase activase-related protein [candidate division WOR-3 bacterium]|nr:acyl-CoA dehydratase activase-related protein [candidate division WOR-3 bacterium]MCX7757358.1 acyl-CoA dehydratase activase-related protein [candidate division WOR-3 bacterium]MDW7987484.1 acyl-CoA dehydratase activase-related protein [candidate division WOR-3 bacterium]